MGNFEMTFDRASLTQNEQIILDECHKAKNLVPTGSGKPTKTGITVLQLQDLLPKARVVYCSATGQHFNFIYFCTLRFQTNTPCSLTFKCCSTVVGRRLLYFIQGRPEEIPLSKPIGITHKSTI